MGGRAVGRSVTRSTPADDTRKRPAAVRSFIARPPARLTA